MLSCSGFFLQKHFRSFGEVTIWFRSLVQIARSLGKSNELSMIGMIRIGVCKVHLVSSHGSLQVVVSCAMSINNIHSTRFRDRYPDEDC